MPEIRWGIVGCGDVCEVKSGPGLYKAENSALVAVMRRNGELAADFARRHTVARWYDDGDRLINDPEVDAVYMWRRRPTRTWNIRARRPRPANRSTWKSRWPALSTSAKR